MAKEKEKREYRVTKLSFIDNRLVEPGDTVFYDGRPGNNLEQIGGTPYPKANKNDAMYADDIA